MRIILGLLLLFLAIGLGLQLNVDPGYVLIAVNHWTIETTLWVALLGMFISFFLLHFIFNVLHRILHFPSRYRAWRMKRRLHKAQAKTRQGLIEFSEGYWSEAQNHLIKALPDVDTPLFNYLTAARAAQEMGDCQLRDNYLREAQQSMPDARIAVELTQAQLQLAHHQWEQALATLRHLQDLAPKHPYVLKLLMRLYQEVRDWPQLIQLLPQLKRNHVISDSEYNKLERTVYLQHMKDLIHLELDGELTQFMKNLPRSLKDDDEFTLLYSRFLVAQQQEAQAEVELKRFLRKKFSEPLIDLYGQINISEQQLSFAETFLKKHADSAVLYLSLSRLSIAQHLWGKARDYLTKSISLAPSAAAYAEMGTLLERFGEQQEACAAFRNGLNLVHGTSIGTKG